MKNIKSLANLLRYLTVTGVVALAYRGAAEEIGSSGSGIDCNGGTIIQAYWIIDGVKYVEYETYNGNCTVTLNYYRNSVLYQGPVTYPVYGVCGCPDETIIPSPFGQWENIPISIAQLSAANTTFVAATNIDHYTVYNLADGALVLNSGSLSCTGSTSGNATTDFTLDNSRLVPGNNYIAAACSADNLIQGSASFQAGDAGTAITVLPQFEVWQSILRRVPGVSISAVVAPGKLATLVQYADGAVVVGGGTVLTTPALTLTMAGDQEALFWPASATHYVLQSNTNQVSPNWVTVTKGTPIVGIETTNSQPGAEYRLEVP
jgi:hypothetical protein